MFEEERANIIFRTVLKIIILSFSIGSLLGGLLTYLMFQLW
jgi:hypothetical protein